MEFTVRKADILNVLSKVQGLTGRKTNLAITTNVLIEALGAGIVIRATDLETGFDGFFPANVTSEGTIAINSRKLYEIVRDFPSDDIHVKEVENNWIEIGNRHVEYHLVGMNPDDFPEIPKFEDMPFFQIDGGALIRIIDQTVYISGASDDRRAHIIGSFLESVSETDRRLLRIVSTDGSRLAKADLAVDNVDQWPVVEGLLVPKKGLHEVGRFLDPERSVGIGVKDSNLVFKKENETIIIRLLEGEFPQYSDIIKTNNEVHSVLLDRQLFAMMLKRMSILSTEDYRSVIFKFTEDKLTITSTNPDIGESKEEMAIEFKGDGIEAAFNPRYFIEALNVIDSEKVVLDIVDDEKPCRLTGEQEPDFLTVIMPMRI